MERRFHMKIFRLFHAQRAELRPMGAALGLGAGQPTLLTYLTDKGRKAASDWAACCERFDERLRRGFSEAEREQFANYLGRAYRNLRGEEVGET